MERCPLCRFWDARLVMRRLGGAVVRCARCSLLYHAPLGAYRTQAYYDRIYRDPSDGVKPEIARHALFEAFLASELPARSRRLLDFGCGLGSFVRTAASKGFDAYGVERSRHGVEAARRAGLDVAMSVDAFPDHFFDIATLWNVIEFFEAPVAQLRQIRRVLAPGGLIFIRTPNALFHHACWRLSTVLASRRTLPCAFLFNPLMWSPASLAVALRTAGFSGVVVDNATLSPGDPYGAFPGQQTLVAFGKRLLSVLAAAVARTSRRQLLVASSIEARARSVLASSASFRSPAAAGPRTGRWYTREANTDRTYGEGSV